MATSHYTGNADEITPRPRMLPKIEVPMISGPVSMTVSKGASSGQRLRLKGKGVRPANGPPGDQYVRLKIVLPDKIDTEMEDLARRWRETVRHDPRKNMGRVT